MALFARKKIAASAGPCTPVAVASGAGLVTAAVGAGRDRAMALPTISRSRDIICSLVASLPIRQYGTQWNGEDLEEIPLPPEPWMLRPDAMTTRAHTLAWTTDDLMFHGVAYWKITRRYAATGFPAEFQWMPADLVSVTSPMTDGNIPIGGISSMTFNGYPVDPADVVFFYSPISPILEVGYRAIRIAERLDAAAERFACTEIPAGYLRQTAGEPMDSDYMAALSESWSEARRTNTTAVLSENLEYVPTTADASNLQITEGRQHAALDLARVANCPPYLAGVAVGGMTYQNAQQARQDAVIFGALPFIDVIEQTLSSEKVTPRGRIVKLDRSAWIENHDLNDRPAETPTPEEART